jgi:hypothetical protein
VFFFKFIFFQYPSASDEQAIDLEVETIFARNNMRCELAPDGQVTVPMFQIINAVEGYPIDDQYGKKKTSEILKEHKAEFEYHRIHYMKNRYGPATPAVNLHGFKALLNYLTGELAVRYKKYSIKTTTRFEAGDKSMHDALDANAASSNILNKMARDAVAQENAEAGSIEHKAHADKQPHELEVQTMKIAFERQQYAFEQDKLDRETARKNEERKTAAYESLIETKKKVAAAKEAKLAAETSMIAFDLQQKQAAAAAEAEKTASAAPTPVKEKAPPQKGIHKPTSSRAKKGVTGKQARTVIHLPGQTRLSFPTIARF